MDMKIKDNHSKQLLKAINLCVNKVIDDGFDKSLKTCRPQLQTIRKSFNVNNREAQVLALIVAASMTEARVMATDIGDMIGKNEWQLIDILYDIESLEKKKIVEGSYKSSFGSYGELAEFSINLTKSTRLIFFSGFLSCPKIGKESIYSILKETETMVDERNVSEVNSDQIVERVEEMLKGNAGAQMNAKFKKYGLSVYEKILILYTLQESIKTTGSDIESFSDKFFNDYNEQMEFFRSFRNGNNTLIKHGLVQMDDLTINLTSKAIKDFLPNDTYLIEEKTSVLIMPKSIKSEQLYYPAKVQAELNKIETWIDPMNFEKYGQKLIKKGFCKGISILLDGPPGCGKTAYSYSLALKTGYPILKVEVQDILSKWVGAAEGRLKDVFNRARTYASELGKPVIILMDEGDAVLNRRNNYDLSSAGRSNNNLNTIILKELESMENIFILCTNAHRNTFDVAYNRRFTYKVHMESPGKEIRYKIWHKHLPKFSKNALNSLSTYELSGSEIANVIRKVTLFEIENNVTARLTEIKKMIDNEGNHVSYNPIGFK